MELGNLIFGNSRGIFEFPNREIVNSKEWENLLKFAKCDEYGVNISLNEYDGFKNEIFEIHPYYWGECTCGQKLKDKICLDNCMLERNNFIYKPTGFTIDWYKYPFRDSYMNKDISEKEILSIFKKCITESKGE